MKNHLIKFLTVLFVAFSVNGQTEILTNSTIIEMSKSGLGKEIILQKINDAANNFDVSANALIELKKSNVADEVISRMLEKAKEKKPLTDNSQGFSESSPNVEVKQPAPTVTNAKDALLNAKTVAIIKSSLNPSRQSLEKALLKRKEWSKYNLTLVRYKEEADIYIDIGRIPFSWLTHRYVFRIYDRRTGTIITAGETTSWGSLAENLAREVTQKIDAVSGK